MIYLHDGKHAQFPNNMTGKAQRSQPQGCHSVEANVLWLSSYLPNLTPKTHKAPALKHE